MPPTRYDPAPGKGLFSRFRRPHEERIDMWATQQNGADPRESVTMGVSFPASFSSAAKEELAKRMVDQFAASAGLKIAGRQHINGGPIVTVFSNETTVSDKVVQLPRR